MYLKKFLCYTFAMAFRIQWDDVPEKADADNFASLYSMEKDSENSVNQADSSSSAEKEKHIFIEGDNYPALKFLQKDYSGKIDFIYIDPPYNTGKTNFTYNDSFNVDSWLSFMNRRLQIAKDLLSERGCIFIAIGQEELYRLKLLCDQIFGEENFINDFMWLHGKGKKDSFSRTMQQSNICYAKNRKKLKAFSDYEITDWAKNNLDDDERGNWFSGSISFSEERSNSEHPNFYEIISPSGVKWNRQWLIKKAEMENLLAQNKIYWGQSPEYNNVPSRKIFNGEKTEIIPKNIIDGAESTRSAQNHVDALLGEKNSFDNPKPVNLIQHLIQITGMPDNITVLDFFAGSGTTFEAVIRQNQQDNGKRRCIIIQKPEKIEKSPLYKNIAHLCFTRIKKIIPPQDGIEYYRCTENSKK